MFRFVLRRTWLPGLALLALGIPAMAQAQEDTKKKAEATPAKKITPAGENIQAQNREQSEGQKKFLEIQMAFRKLDQEAIKDYLAAKPEDKQKLLVATAAKIKNLPRAEYAQKAFDLLKTLDEKDPAIPAILQYVGFMDSKSTERMEALVKEGNSRVIKGNAYLILGLNGKHAATHPDLSAEKAAELNKRAESYFETVVKDFAGVAGPQGTVDETAKGALTEMRFLKIGAVAPDVACLNIDGEKEDKLSNYKGKVVVLDVWTTWCGPCKAMIPHEREMVAKLKGKKFALISVSGDEEKETLVKFLETTKMPWIHWFAGQKGLIKDWNIRYYPTIYIIDHKGVIRAKDLNGDKLEKKVEELLAEMEKEKVG